MADGPPARVRASRVSARVPFLAGSDAIPRLRDARPRFLVPPFVATGPSGFQASPCHLLLSFVTPRHAPSIGILHTHRTDNCNGIANGHEASRPQPDLFLTSPRRFLPAPTTQATAETRHGDHPNVGSEARRAGRLSRRRRRRGHPGVCGVAWRGALSGLRGGVAVPMAALSDLRARRRGRPDGDGAATPPPGFPSVASLAAPPETPPLAPLLTRRQRPTQTSRKPPLLRPRIQRTAARDPGGTNGTRIYRLRRDHTGQVLSKE